MKLYNLLNKIFGEEIDTKIRSVFFKGSVYSFLIQLFLSLVTFLTTILIARLTGDKGLGIYTIVFTWVGLIYSTALFGLDDLLVKNTSILKESSSVFDLFKWSYKTGTTVSLSVGFLFFIIVNYSNIPGLYDYRHYYNIAIISIPFFVIMQINQAIVRGLGFLSHGQLPEKVFQPLFFVLSLIVFYFLTYQLDDVDAIICRTISFIFVAFISILIVIQKRKKLVLGPEILTNNKLWFRSCIFFTLSTLLYALNTRVDIILLSLFEIEPESIAYYNVALKFSDLALIPYMVICTVSAPIFSTLFHQNKIAELQKFYSKINKISTLAVVLIIVPFIIFGNWFLSWYGQNFISGYNVLVLLCITKFIHVAVGPANYLLNMTGKERLLVLVLLLSIVINIILQIILIPIYKIEGSAMATLLSLLVFDFCLAIVTYYSTGISVLSLGKNKRKY